MGRFKRNNKDAKPKGRKSTYNEDYPRMAYAMCSRTGAEKQDLAKLFNVCPETISNWIEWYPAFFQSIKDGMEHYDLYRVHRALVDRACGYNYEEVTTEEVSVEVAAEPGNGEGKRRRRTNGNGNGGNGNGNGVKVAMMSVPGKKITRKTKHVLPNPQCLFFYLCNRDKDNWKHMMQHVKLEGDFKSSFQKIDWNKLTDQLGAKDMAKLGELLQPISNQLDNFKSAGSGRSSS